MLFLIKVILSAILISFASWLSFKKPIMAGFLVSLPLASIITIFFSYIEHRDLEKSITFAKSILIGVPISLLFFLPFFLAKQLNFSFFQTFFLGIIILIIGYFIHKGISNFL